MGSGGSHGYRPSPEMKNFHRHAEDNIVLRAQMQRIIDHYDLRSEMYTNDADLAANLAAIAREALQQVGR